MAIEVLQWEIKTLFLQALKRTLRNSSLYDHGKRINNKFMHWSFPLLLLNEFHSCLLETHLNIK